MSQWILFPLTDNPSIPVCFRFSDMLCMCLFRVSSDAWLQDDSEFRLALQHSITSASCTWNGQQHWALVQKKRTLRRYAWRSRLMRSERLSSSLQPSKFGVFSWKQHLTVIQYCFACIKSFNATSIWESPHSEVDSDMLCSKHFLFSCSSLTIFSDAGCSMLMLPLYPTDFACHCLTCLFLFWEPMHTCIMGLAKREWRITTGIDSNP